LKLGINLPLAPVDFSNFTLLSTLAIQTPQIGFFFCLHDEKYSQLETALLVLFAIGFIRWPGVSSSGL